MNKNIKRPDWDEWFSSLAELYARRSPCQYVQVGILIARGNIQLAESYNKNVLNMFSLEEGIKQAEINAIKNVLVVADNKSMTIKGGTAYTTHNLSDKAKEILEREGITRIVSLNKDPLQGVKRLKPIDIDEWFLQLAGKYAERATCKRAHVGAIIARDDLQLAEGYNGSITGDEHCTHDDCCLNSEGRCIRTIHAEQNAIINASKKGINMESSTAYVTHEPCETCTKLLRQAGTVRVVYRKAYPNQYNKIFNRNIEWIHKPKQEEV